MIVTSRPSLRTQSHLIYTLRNLQGSLLAARPPKVSASQCSRNPLGSVFMRRVSLPTASAEQYVPWWWCQLGTLHSFSLQRICGAVQTIDSWAVVPQKQHRPFEGQSLT